MRENRIIMKEALLFLFTSTTLFLNFHSVNGQDLWGHLTTSDSPLAIEKLETYNARDNLQWYGVLRPSGKGNDLNLLMFDSDDQLSTYAIVERDKLGRAKRIKNFDANRDLVNYTIIKYDWNDR